MKYIKLYEEYSNSDSFYLVIEDVNRLMNNPDFKDKCILHGLKGVSENERILDYLGSNCDVFIEMNKNAVLTENNLVKMKYDDINFLSNDNFKMFKRIKGGGSYNLFIEITYMIQQYEHHLFNLENENEELYNLLISNQFKTFLKTEQKNFSDITDFTNYVYQFLKHQDYNKIKSDLSYMFLDLVERYKYEEEWFILNDSFKVPDNSIVELYPDFIADNIGEENVEDCLNYFKSINNLKIVIL